MGTPDISLSTSHGAKGYARYLFDGAVKLTTEQRAALKVENGQMAISDALLIFQRPIEREMEADYRTLANGLAVAFEASGERDRAHIAREMADLNRYDFERFDELSGGLRLSLVAEAIPMI